MQEEGGVQGRGVRTETENRRSGFQFCSKATDELWMESASKSTIVKDEHLSKGSFYSDWVERAILYLEGKMNTTGCLGWERGPEVGY